MRMMSEGYVQLLSPDGNLKKTKLIILFLGNEK